MSTQQLPPTETWLADFAWLVGNPPPGCSPEYKSKLFSLGSGIYAFNAALLGGAAAPQTAIQPSATVSDTVLALIRRADGAGMTAGQIVTETGMRPQIIGRALASLKGQNLVAETAAGQYIVVGAGNVQGIDQKMPRRRGRPPATDTEARTGTNG